MHAWPVRGRSGSTFCSHPAGGLLTLAEALRLKIHYRGVHGGKQNTWTLRNGEAAVTKIPKVWSQQGLVIKAGFGSSKANRFPVVALCSKVLRNDGPPIEVWELHSMIGTGCCLPVAQWICMRGMLDTGYEREGVRGGSKNADPGWLDLQFLPDWEPYLNICLLVPICTLFHSLIDQASAVRSVLERPVGLGPRGWGSTQGFLQLATSREPTYRFWSVAKLQPE